MAVQSVPFVETALSHSAELFRRELQSGLPFGSAGGVVPATPAASANLTAGVAGCSDLQVTAPVSGMSVNISAGQVIMPGSLGSGSGYGIGVGYGYPTITTNGGSAPTVASNAKATQVQLTTQGAYYGYNDNSAGAVNLTVAAANGTNPRIDMVVAQAEDAAYSGSNNDWKLAVITGTAAASPAIPSLPASCIPLAAVWIPNGSTSVSSGNILDLRVAYNRNPFAARVHRGSAWSTSTGPTSFAFDTVDYDITGMTSGGASSFVVPVTGRYVMTAQLWCTFTAAGQWIATELFRNSSQFQQGLLSTGAALGQGTPATDLVSCNEGDTLLVKLACSTGSLTGGASGLETYMAVSLESPL